MIPRNPEPHPRVALLPANTKLGELFIEHLCGSERDRRRGLPAAAPGRSTPARPRSSTRRARAARRPAVTSCPTRSKTCGSRWRSTGSRMRSGRRRAGPAPVRPLLPRGRARGLGVARQRPCRRRQAQGARPRVGPAVEPGRGVTGWWCVQGYPQYGSALPRQREALLRSVVHQDTPRQDILADQCMDPLALKNLDLHRGYGR